MTMKGLRKVFSLAVSLLLVAGATPLSSAPQKGGKSTRYQVTVHHHAGIDFAAPTYLPTCPYSASASASNYSYVPQPRHDPCANVTTSTGYQLTDDIGINVKVTKGLITSITLYGQDVYGEEGIAHRSEAFPITPPVKPSSGGFTLHVHADNLPVWKLSEHLGGDRVEIVGYISIGDITYTPE